jgi:hypothetical protein
LTRWLFPQDRLVFRYGTPGTPLYSPQGDTVTIYTDSAGTTLASIQAPNGTPIGSTLDIGSDCLIPQFLGPDGLTQVYARNSAGALTTLYAQTGQIVQSLSGSYVPVSAKGAANGVASLGSDGKVPSGQLPPAPSSAVTSVNTKTGPVTLTSSDVGAYSASSGATLASRVTDVESGRLLVENNLSDLDDAGASRINLGLGAAALRNVGTTSGTVADGGDARITGAAQKSANLSDLDAPTARTNLGLGNSSTRNVGTSTNQIAAGDDSRITGALQADSNLSDLDDAATARTSLGLGGAATKNVGTSSTTVAAGDAPAAVVASHVAASDPHGDRANAASTYLPLAGGTVAGQLVLNRFGAVSGYPIGSTGAVDSVSIPSTYTGGDDDGTGTDTTGRLNLYSYQRANFSSFGETIRNFAMRSDAKTMLAFYLPVQTSTKKGGYDPATRNPMSSGIGWKPVVWTGAHYEANDHGSVHGHWELEIADSTGALQGRLEVPFINQAVDGAHAIDNVAIGIDYTNIRTNLADFSVRAQNMATGTYAGQNTALRVGGNNTVHKDLQLSISSDMGTTGRRWILRANNTTEAGGDTGTDLQILRYDDAGTLLDAPIAVTRSTGLVSIGGSSGTAGGLSLTRASGIALTILPTATGGQGAMVTGTDTTARSWQGQVSGDTTTRHVTYVDGKQEWGTGAATRDTNLYRSNVAVLKTDGALQATTALRLNTTSLGGGIGVLGMADATTPPAGTPTGGGVMYSSSGLPRWKGSDGTDYDLAHGQQPITVVRKTADETVTSSITVQDDDQLVVSVAANGIYLMDAFLLYDGDTAGDLRVTFTGPTGALMDWTVNGASASQTGGTGSIKLARQPLGVEDTVGASGAGVKAVALPRGLLTVGSTAGSLTLRWAQATSSATATTLFANSWLRVTKIA